MNLRLALALGALLSACGSSFNDSDVKLTVANGQPWSSSYRCGDGCGSSGNASVEVDYVATSRPTNATLTLLQYRVDYLLDGLPGSMPFHAGTLQQKLAPGDSVKLDLTVLGSAQRNWLVTQASNTSLTGTAHLTLAGYDALDDQIELEATFPIRLVPGS